MYYKMKIAALSSEGKEKTAEYVVKAESPIEAHTNIVETADHFVASIGGADGFRVVKSDECKYDQIKIKEDNESGKETAFWKGSIDLLSMDGGKTTKLSCLVEAFDYKDAHAQISAEYCTINCEITAIQRTKINAVV